MIAQEMKCNLITIPNIDPEITYKAYQKEILLYIKHSIYVFTNGSSLRLLLLPMFCPSDKIYLM